MTGDSAVLLVRLRAGVVGESRRSVHVVPFPVVKRGGVMVAYCGLPIVPIFAEYLETLRGMPCELCVARAPGEVRPGTALAAAVPGPTDR